MLAFIQAAELCNRPIYNEPMNSKMTYCLFSSLILMFGYLTSVIAVTDAELEELEKQLEQLEEEEKKQIEYEDKKKAEQKRKAEIEARKKREAEAKKNAVVEAKRKAAAEAEQKRFDELERQRQEEEAKKEKYNLLIAEAEQALNDKDKELAISKYNEALTLIPGDPVANSGIKEAGKLKHKVCYEVLGSWQYPQAVMDIKEDGTFEATGIATSTWKCTDPKNRTIELKIPLATMTAVLSDDGQCLNTSTWASSAVFNRLGHVCENYQPSETPTEQKPLGL